MRIARKRQIAARILLSIFIPMMVMMYTHVHQAEPVDSSVCTLCMHHVHHAGHLSAQGTTVHDCLVCQLISMPFVLPVLAILASTILLTVRMHRQSATCVPISRIFIKSPRAPPVFL